MVLVIIPVSDRHNLLSGGGSSRQECYQGGNSIWARVDLASGEVGECCSGHWDGIDLASGEI